MAWFERSNDDITMGLIVSVRIYLPSSARVVLLRREAGQQVNLAQALCSALVDTLREYKSGRAFSVIGSSE